MRMIRYTWRLMAGNKWSFISWLVLAALSSALLAMPPVVIGRMIDAAIPSGSTSTVMRYAAAIAAALIVSTTLQALSKLLLDRLANRVVAELRLQLFGWMHRKQLRALNGLGADSLYQRATQSISMLQEKIMLIMRDIFGVTVSALIGLAIIMTIDPWTPVLFLAVFIPYVALRRRIFSRKGYTFYEQAESYGAIVQSVREAVQGIRLIRMSHTEEEELARFGSRQKEHIAIQVRHIHVFSSLLMLNVLMTLVPELIVYGYLGWKVHAGHTTIGSMIVVVGLLGQIRAFVWQVSRYGMMTREFLDHLDRVYELERLPDEPLLAARGETATKNMPPASLAFGIDKRRDEGAAVSFRNVTFSYLSQPVLDRFSLDLPAGTSTGIVGLSGAGKTTLANLLVGLDQPEGGVIMVDGVPVTELDMNGYRQRICFITQQPYLLNASIRDNVCYGLDRIPDEAVWQALFNTLMDDVVRRLENGLDTVIGENGIQLSGGQKQRLAIARAYLANPRIVIMDEATAALDLESEHAVQQSLERLCKGRTSLIIAHRLTTLGAADRIAVISEGKLAELGSHAELMNRRQFYYRLYMEQYKPSEGRRAE